MGISLFSVKLATTDLHHTQSLFQVNSLNKELIDREKSCLLNLWSVLDREEILLQQKSRATWFALGDRNSRFFSNMVKSRYNYNKILSIQTAEGELVVGQEAVETVAVNYFTHMFNPSPTPYNGIGDYASIPHHVINPAQANLLSAPITDMEIFKVLNSMKRNKSPGPDSFNVNFFINCWDIVGADFTDAVKYFFSSCRMTKGLNSTAITLVPKCANLSTMADFRPIACCNTIYKCIAKILSNRLKEVLPSIIDKAQSAFVKGRNINDNILLAQELFRN